MVYTGEPRVTLSPDISTLARFLEADRIIRSLDIEYPVDQTVDAALESDEWLTAHGESKIYGVHIQSRGRLVDAFVKEADYPGDDDG